MLKNLYERWKLKSEKSGTQEYWGRWYKEQRERYPVRFFLQYTVSQTWHRHVAWPVKNTIWWVRYRTTNRNHVIKLRSLRPGYWDDDTLMLHACFQLLADHVEIGLGSLNTQWHDDHPTIWRWWKSRYPEAGIDYLDWAINDEDVKLTQQATDCREQKSLYIWWTIERPKRNDPWTSPRIWGDVPEDDDVSKIFSQNPERENAGRIAHNTEEVYALEDQAMLERLIKVRRSLWS